MRLLSGEILKQYTYSLVVIRKGLCLRLSEKGKLQKQIGNKYACQQWSLILTIA